jgi:hypothetical protein
MSKIVVTLLFSLWFLRASASQKTNERFHFLGFIAAHFIEQHHLSPITTQRRLVYDNELIETPSPLNKQSCLNFYYLLGLHHLIEFNLA